jgi:hypothetical protein
MVRKSVVGVAGGSGHAAVISAYAALASALLIGIATIMREVPAILYARQDLTRAQSGRPALGGDQARAYAPASTPKGTRRTGAPR